MQVELENVTEYHPRFITPTFLVAGIIIYYVCLLYYPSLRLRSRGLSLPPGPAQKWITGNLHQFPREKLWLQATKWAKQYGPIIHIRLVNKRIVFLNSANVASDLLNSRSSIYSDRPKTYMSELANRTLSIFRTPFADPRFKILRRLLQDGLNPRAVRSYRSIQMKETLELLKSLAQCPDDFQAHIRRNAVSVIIKVAYGYQVCQNDDPIVRNLEDSAFKLGTTLSTLGDFWVETIPLLRLIPSWFPGGGYKRVARMVGKEVAQLEGVPFNWAKEQMLTGNFVESFTSKHLLADGGQFTDSQKQDLIKWAGSALYFGGGETTVSALTTFFFLMALYPEVQRKAQTDIDQVAPNRLPTFEDYNALPYIKAVIKEVIRWGPVAPLGLPHRVMEDDIYDHYFIPKGATIICNIWAISHDEKVYPNPSHFDPSRHLGDNPQLDPFRFVFGFGRRACPGAHLAEMSLFFNIVNILAVFSISKYIDEEGKEVEPQSEWTSGITSHLKPFKCRITPRSDGHLSLLPAEPPDSTAI